MGCCCFRPSLSSSNKSKAPLSHLYISPLPETVSEAQLPAAVSNSVSQTHIVDKKVHFSSTENVRIESMSLDADSKQSSGEGESYESLFSLQLVNGWNTSNEEEVMSKEIYNNDHDTNSKTEASDESSTFPITIHSSCENEEVSVEISLSSWLVDLEQENSSTNTPISNNVVKDSIDGKLNDVSEKRRVLGERNLVEVDENHGQSLKTKLHKEDQKVDLLHKAIPLGLNLARSAMRRGMV